MEDVNLISSATVLRLMAETKRDIYDILSEFIRFSLSKRSIKSFTYTDCSRFLKDDFDFSIPDAVVKSCIKNRLRVQNKINLSNGVYVIESVIEGSSKFDSDFEGAKVQYVNLVDDLFSYVNSAQTGQYERSEVEKSLEKLLTRPDQSDKLGALIATFILEKENEPGFSEKLQLIEEGLILYTGIRYSPDLSTLGAWRNNLTVFLGLEHLFSAAGLNGDLYKKIFYDFYSLVQEVNKSKKSGTIELRYLDETAQEIDEFFHAASQVVKYERAIEPNKTAMIEICNGASCDFDVSTKKAKFKSTIKSLGIHPAEPQDYYHATEYNIESDAVNEAVLNTFSESNVDEREVYKILKIFTKVNFHRKGISDVGVDGVSAIYLTESRVAREMAFSPHIHAGNREIPFATHIEFLTERIWFKLNKGFGGDSKIASFDPIIRARIILSEGVGKKLLENYKELYKKYKNGEVDKETLAELHFDLYSVPVLPESITPESLEQTRITIDSDYINNVVAEKEMLKTKAKEGEIAAKERDEAARQRDLAAEERDKIKEELDAARALAESQRRMQRQSQFEEVRRKTKLISGFVTFGINLTILMLILLGTYMLASEADSLISALSFFLAVTALLYNKKVIGKFRGLRSKYLVKYFRFRRKSAVQNSY